MMLSKPPFTYWIALFCFLARSACADYSCLCNYQVELPIYSAMDTTSTPVGYMYEFDCKPVAAVNYPTDGWNVIMNEHSIAFVEKSSSVLTQVCQGNIPSEDKVKATAGQNNTTSIRPMVSDTTVAVKLTTTTTTPQPLTTARATANSESTTTKTTTTRKISTVSTTIKPTTTATTTTIKASIATAPSSITTKPTSSSLPTTTTSTTTTTKTTTTTAAAKTTVMNKFALSPEPSNLNLCPQTLTQTTDARWIRQYKNFCYEIVSGRYEDWYDALQDCHDRHGDDVDGTLLEIYTADIQQFIEQFLQEENHKHPVWIGLQDVDTEESFDHWETDTKLQYENFDPNRKDNYAPHTKEDCVLLEPSGLWDDSICDEDDAISVANGGNLLPYRHSYICQYRTINTQTTTTPSPTTANLLLTNVTGNIQLCPRVVRETTEASLLRQYKQYCYELVSAYDDWYDANQYCRDRGTGLNGLLIEIYTADIQQVIAKALADEGYTHPLWIGLQDVDKEESFDHWESDIPVTYSNFDPNRKDNYANHAQENCVLLEPSGYWDDSVCDVREANQAEQDGHPGLTYNHHWICQYPIRQQNIFG